MDGKRVIADVLACDSLMRDRRAGAITTIDRRGFPGCTRHRHSPFRRLPCAISSAYSAHPCALVSFRRTAMSKRILIVEDEIMISLHIEDTLAGLGHTVVTASSQREAEAIVDVNVIDLAIIDYHLSDGTSANLADKLKQRRVPFIVCSGSAGISELDEIFGGSTFLAKPFTTEGLIDAVTSLSGLTN
ncbi:MAG: response regulator [Hyphomicrobiales bacterium]|nr:MAG: response regulator [Hyphomicrobiales bacterium]